MRVLRILTNLTTLRRGRRPDARAAGAHFRQAPDLGGGRRPVRRGPARNPCSVPELQPGRKALGQKSVRLWVGAGWAGPDRVPFPKKMGLWDGFRIRSIWSPGRATRVQYSTSYPTKARRHPHTWQPAWRPTCETVENCQSDCRPMFDGWVKMPPGNTPCGTVASPVWKDAPLISTCDWVAPTASLADSPPNHRPRAGRRPPARPGRRRTGWRSRSCRTGCPR